MDVEARTRMVDPSVATNVHTTGQDNDPAYPAWKEFVSRHVVSPSVNPLVGSSWLRCWPRLHPFQKLNLSHLSQDHLLATQVANFGLLSVARPIMEDIYQCVEKSNTVTVLINSAGYILDMIGDPEILESIHQHGIFTGTMISEAQLGTNAFSLAIAERVPVSVSGAEHFMVQFHDLAETAAPIFDVSGHPIGAFGLITDAGKQNLHSTGLAMAGARAIEAQRQTDILLGEQNSQLASLNAILASISEGIMVWNAEGVLMHVNKAAIKSIGLPVHAIVGRQISEILTLPAFVDEALQNREVLTDVEATLRFDQHPISCFLSLRFVTSQDKLQWTILTLRQEKEVRQLLQNQFGAQAFSTLDDLTGESYEMRKVLRLSKTAAAARASILIRGESGTGKNMLASAIHNESAYRDGPFMIFACSSVPNELIVSELLGYEEGISRKRPGGRPSKFELANGGTLFFQDVDALPLEAQGILLNVLDLGIVQRLGSNRPIATDVRVIAATSATMEKLIAQGSFRADLYYRLSSFEITLPPLRERQKDIPLLVERSLNRLSRQLKRRLSLAPGVLELLKKYPWPGNVRELEAIIGRAVVQSGVSEIVGPMHLPDFIHHPTNLSVRDPDGKTLQSLGEMERQAFIEAARACDGNVTQMARVLNIGRTTVWRKLKTFNISPDDFRHADGQAAEQ